jgi:hypothetical protein
VSRPFRLGRAANDLEAAALRYHREGSALALQGLKFAARRFGRELERMRALNAAVGR